MTTDYPTQGGKNAAKRELLVSRLLTSLMLNNQSEVGPVGLWVEGGLASEMCFHIWLPLNELEYNACTHFSDPLQHMG